VFLSIATAFLVESIKDEFKHKPSDRDLLSLGFEVFLAIVLFICLLVMVFMSVIYSEFKIKNIKRSKNSVIASAF
jgi:hypothetical protein